MVEYKFPEYGLSAEYGVVEIGEVSNFVTVEIYHADILLVSEVYWPDYKGMIYIHGIADLAMMFKQELYLHQGNEQDGTKINLYFVLKEGNNVLTKTVSIYPCEVDTGSTLSVPLLYKIPLTRVTKKVTGIGRLEFASFYGPCTVDARIYYKGGSSIVSMFTITQESAFYRINVSPHIIASLIGKSPADLIYYEVFSSLESVLHFTIDERRHRNTKTFAFRNSFQTLEMFTCTGDLTCERKWKRDFGFISNQKNQISGELENIYTINSGYIFRDSIEILEDLMNSDTICLFEDNSFQKIVILEESFKVSSRKDELVSIEFSYRFAAKQQLQTRYKKKTIKKGIFNSKFNNIFG